MDVEVAVLWVDEGVATQRIYETLLRAIGVQLITMTTCCDTALGVAAMTRFHLVILDAGLSGGGARAAAKFLRSGVGASSSARIVLAAHEFGSAGFEDDGLFDAVLQRPVTARALRDEIVTALSPHADRP